MLRRHTQIRHMPRPSQITETQSLGSGDFAVITCHFNWANFVRPKQNLHRFIRHIRSLGIPLFGVEAVLPGQKPQTAGITGWQQIVADNDQILFQKECLLNLAEKLVPEKFTKLAWVDCDVQFGNTKWGDETSILLDHFAFVQPFETAAWTNIDGTELFRKPSTLRIKGGLPANSHPGFAMAARRSLWKDLGGLYQNLVVGNGDMGIAAAILGQEIPPTQQYSEPLHRHYSAWHQGVMNFVNEKGYAYTRGTLWHDWHGSMKDRRYLERNMILSQMDPNRDLVVCENGLLAWTKEAPDSLVDYVRDYFTNRKEDGGGSEPDAVISGGIKNTTYP